MGREKTQGKIALTWELLFEVASAMMMDIPRVVLFGTKLNQEEFNAVFLHNKT